MLFIPVCSNFWSIAKERKLSINLRQYSCSKCFALLGPALCSVHAFHLYLCDTVHHCAILSVSAATGTNKFQIVLWFII